MNDNTINNDLTMGGAVATLLANRYRVIRQLGQGGMGSVWLAEDTQLDNRQVAIKMLPSVLVSNKRAYNQLKAEALVSLKLTHPNIATVRAFEENNGNPFLVVDYIDGITLDDYLVDRDSGAVGAERRPYQEEEGRAVAPRPPHPGGLPEAEVIRLLKPIAAALDYAHSKGVIHRDVKPGNVMIAKDGTPYILDFGIAREIQETMTRVTGKMSSGTLLYMSPEQLHGAAPTPAQDVYSFAAMVYECLTGAPPFSRGQIEYQIEHDMPAPVDPQFAKCGSGIMAGLAKNPKDRPENCANVLSGMCSVAHDAQKNSSSTSHGLIVTVVALLALCVVCAAGYVWCQGRQEAILKQAKIARLAAEEKTLEMEKAEAAAKRERADQAAAEAVRKENEKVEAEKAREDEVRIAKERERTCIAQKREQQEAVLTEARSALLVTVIETDSGRKEVKADVLIGDKKYVSPVEWKRIRKGNFIPSAFASYCDGAARYEGTSQKTPIDWDGENKIVFDLPRYDVPFRLFSLQKDGRVVFQLKNGSDVPLIEVSVGDRIGETGYVLTDYQQRDDGNFYSYRGVGDTPCRKGVATVKRISDNLEVECTHWLWWSIDGKNKVEYNERILDRSVDPSSTAARESKADVGEYTVQHGDTLGSIAYGHGMSIRELKKLNGIIDDALTVGQRLRLKPKNETGISDGREGKKRVREAETQRNAAEARRQSEAHRKNTMNSTAGGGVQLWENGPYWAECNVGATKPEEAGYYFWWGDTVGYRRVGDGWQAVDGSRRDFAFSAENCLTYGKDSSQLRAAGYIDSTGNLTAAHDAAAVHLGTPWRMPTDEEWEALEKNCISEWMQRNGVYGRLVTGKGIFASKSIFLPVSGFGAISGLCSYGSGGYFWSSVPTSNGSDTESLYFTSRNFDRKKSRRYCGESVRPVREFVK